MLAAEMLNNQSVALLQGDQAQTALDVLAATGAAFEQAGEKLKLAMDWGNRAAALDALDQVEEAEAAYQQSAELLAEQGEDKLRADVMKALSGLQLRKGRQMEALGTMRAGVAGIKRPSLAQRMLKKILELPSKFLG